MPESHTHTEADKDRFIPNLLWLQASGTFLRHMGSLSRQSSHSHTHTHSLSPPSQHVELLPLQLQSAILQSNTTALMAGANGAQQRNSYCGESVGENEASYRSDVSEESPSNENTHIYCPPTAASLLTEV